MQGVDLVYFLTVVLEELLCGVVAWQVLSHIKLAIDVLLHLFLFILLLLFLLSLLFDLVLVQDRVHIKYIF